MIYKVTKQFGRGPESVLEQFSRLEKAEAFVQEQLAEDARYKVETTYRIYDAIDNVLKEATPADYQPDMTSSESGGQSKESSKVFRPTPFDMKPALGPRSWIKDEEDDDKSKK